MLALLWQVTKIDHLLMYLAQRMSSPAGCHRDTAVSGFFVSTAAVRARQLMGLHGPHPVNTGTGTPPGTRLACQLGTRVDIGTRVVDQANVG